VTVIQRFGSTLNLNVHLHSLVLEGVFTRPSAAAAPVFHTLPPPSDQDIAKLLEQVHHRVLGLLRRRGRLPEDPSPTDPVAEQLPLLAAMPPPPSRSGSPAGLGPVTRSAGCARRPPSPTNRNRGVRAWRASPFMPMSPSPRTPATNWSTCAATSCAHPWRSTGWRKRPRPAAVRASPSPTGWLHLPLARSPGAHRETLRPGPRPALVLAALSRYPGSPRRLVLADHPAPHRRGQPRH
jgi:Putative transposase